jgi:hypothetical protein
VAEATAAQVTRPLQTPTGASPRQILARVEREAQAADDHAAALLDAVAQDGPQTERAAEAALARADQAHENLEAVQRQVDQRDLAAQRPETEEALLAWLDRAAKREIPETGRAEAVKRDRTGQWVRSDVGRREGRRARTYYDLSLIDEAELQEMGFTSTEELQRHLSDVLRTTLRPATTYRLQGQHGASPFVKDWGETQLGLTSTEASAAAAEIRRLRVPPRIEAPPSVFSPETPAYTPEGQLFGVRPHARMLKGRPAPPSAGGIGAGELRLEMQGEPIGAREPTLPMLAQAEQAVTQAAPEPTVPAGLSMQIVRPGGGAPGEPALHGLTPEMDARMRQALKGVQEPTAAQRVTDGLRTFWHGITRTFPELPRTAQWAPALHELTRLPNRWANAGRDTVVRMAHNVIGFKRPTIALFTEKMLADDLTATLARDPEAALPFGLTPETLAEYKTAVDTDVAKNAIVGERLARRKAHWDEIKDAHVKAYADLGIDVSDRYDRPDYMHHLVLDYAEARRIGTKGGRRLQVPMREGFMRQRRGSAKDIALDYFQYEFESMARMQAATETARTLKNIQDAGYDIRPALEAQAKQTEGQDWHDLIPEGQRTWQPRPGNAVFQVDTLPEELVRQLLDASAKLPIDQAAVKQLLALGSRFREWVIPNELAKTLDDFMAPKGTDPIHRVLQTATQAWKQYVLLNPRRALPFNFRNETGDLEPVLQRNPRSLLRVPRSLSELYSVYTREVAATGDLANWMRDAGPGGQLMAQELGDLRKIESFRSLLPQMEKGNWAGKAWRRYWWVMRKATDFRESVLRYANYLEYLEQMKASPDGRPSNFGASKAGEVMALRSPHDRALKLSNELLGAYDQTSHLGQSLSRYYIPFWRWIEVNTSRTAGIWRNVLTERGVGAAGRIVGMNVAKRAAQAVIGASLTSAYTTAWNMLRFPDEEKQLPSYVRGRPHIILGRNADGSIRYIGRLGAMSDLLDWFGADTARSEVKAYLNGEISLGEMAATMAKAPIQKVYDGLSPTLKNIPEVLGGYTGFPDVTHPRRLRSRMEYVGQQFSATPEVRLLRTHDLRAYLRDVKEATLGETVARPTTRAGELMRQIAAEESPQYTFTPAERRASAVKSEAVKAIRAGKNPPATFSALPPAAQRRAVKEASMAQDEAMLSKLKTPQMLRVYAAANKDERDRYLPLIAARVLNSYKTGNTTKDQATEYVQRLTELTMRPAEAAP